MVVIIVVVDAAAAVAAAATVVVVIVVAALGNTVDANVTVQGSLRRETLHRFNRKLMRLPLRNVHFSTYRRAVGHFTDVCAHLGHMRTGRGGFRRRIDFGGRLMASQMGDLVVNAQLLPKVVQLHAVTGGLCGDLDRMKPNLNE